MNSLTQHQTKWQQWCVWIMPQDCIDKGKSFSPRGQGSPQAPWKVTSNLLNKLVIQEQIENQDLTIFDTKKISHNHEKGCFSHASSHAILIRMLYVQCSMYQRCYCIWFVPSITDYHIRFSITAETMSLIVSTEWSFRPRESTNDLDDPAELIFSISWRAQAISIGSSRLPKMTDTLNVDWTDTPSSFRACNNVPKLPSWVTITRKWSS